jgi:hypothetical protein
MFRSFYKCETTARQLTATDGLKREEKRFTGNLFGADAAGVT